MLSRRAMAAWKIGSERRWTLTPPVAPLPGPGEQGVGPLEVRSPGLGVDAAGVTFYDEPPVEGTDEVEEAL